jgi:hypothetical protein
LQKAFKAITIAGIMNENYRLRKIGADKIALLVLFVLALLIAQIIITARSKLELSEPIELSYAGLSLSIPFGNGWESDKKWYYDENGFSLSSYLFIGTTEPSAWIFCRYHLAPEIISPEIWFEQKAAKIKGVVEEINRIQKDNLNIDWARIECPDTILSIFLGTVELPHNHRLNIEINQMTLETGLAQKVFEQVIESLIFRDNSKLDTGKETVAKIKSEGLDSFLVNKDKQKNFMITNSRKRNIGFALEVLLDSDSSDDFNIQAASHFYLTGQENQEQGASYRGKNSIEEFVWQSQTLEATNKTYSKTVLDETGIVTVVKYSNVGMRENRYELGPTMIPEIFIEPILSQMLQDGIDEIIVDIIDSEGRIIPVFISYIEADKDITKNPDAIYVFRIDFISKQDFSEHVYLDRQKQISRIILHQNRQYILEKTTLENIAQAFPEQADIILTRDEKLKSVF